MTTTQEPQPAAEVKVASQGEARPKWQVAVAAAVLLLAGVGVGAASVDNGDEVAALDRELTASTSELEAAEAAYSDLESDFDAAESENSDLTSDLAAAEARAENAVAEARSKVRAEMADQRAGLNARTEKLDRRARELDARERKVTGMERSWKANTIPGDGIFLVGSDIVPGVYKSGPSPTGNCYYARMDGTDSIGNIIDNGNVSGPLAITIAPSDHHLELSGCGTFHKVG